MLMVVWLDTSSALWTVVDLVIYWEAPMVVQMDKSSVQKMVVNLDLCLVGKMVA